jgi:hypothetical protein
MGLPQLPRQLLPAIVALRPKGRIFLQAGSPIRFLAPCLAIALADGSRQSSCVINRLQVASLGENEAAELFVVDPVSGTIHRIAK